MGSFANSVFSVMLGWIRTAVNQVWELLSSDESGSLLSWVGENWKTLVIIICVAGLIVDGMVYFVRWRPYRVWSSFFRRMRGKGQEADEIPEPVRETPPPRPRPAKPRSAAATMQHTGHAWIYPDGTARAAKVYEPPIGEVVPSYQEQPFDPSYGEEPPLASYATSRELSEQYVNRFARPADPQPAFHVQAAPAQEAPMRFGAMGRAYRRPQTVENLHYEQERVASAPNMTGLEDYPQPPSTEYQAPAAEVVDHLPEREEEPDTVQRRQRKMIQKVATPLRGLGLMDNDDDLQYRYTPPAPAVDKRQAYHEPVYPPSWRPPAGGNAPQQEEKSRWN